MWPLPVVAVLFGGHTVVSYVLSDTFQLVRAGSRCGLSNENIDSLVYFSWDSFSQSWHATRKHFTIKMARSLCISTVQCPLDIATLDLAAALPIATSTPVTNLCHYINSNLVYNDLRIQPLCSK